MNQNPIYGPGEKKHYKFLYVTETGDGGRPNRLELRFDLLVYMTMVYYYFSFRFNHS